MRRPVEDHSDPTWQVHELARDFELLDVWRFPIRVSGEIPFATVVDFLTETQSKMRDRPGFAAALFRLRSWLGRIFGWDDDSRDLAIPDSTEKSIRDRITKAEGREARTVTRVESSSSSGFDTVYRSDEESLRELKNATVHALLHLARVRLDPADPSGEWAPQMAVYVKRRGWLGRFYMALIGPFRHLVVYPTMMRVVAQSWPDYLEEHRLEKHRLEKHRLERRAPAAHEPQSGGSTSTKGGPSAGLASLLVVLIGLTATASRAEDVYSPGGWATLHRDPGNRRCVRDVPLAAEYRTWTALEGASVLTAPTMSPDGRSLYVTTGRALGHSNLHAFALDGTPLWDSEPWTDPDRGVDPCAILSSPIVDRDGDIYVGDCNQLFAFGPDGTTKWVIPLPPLQPGDWVASEVLPINALTTAIFTKEGHVLGVTNFGDVIVVDRASGASLAEAFRLPGLVPPMATAVPMAESVFAGGLIDPEIRVWAWQLLFGGAMRSANTPAVDLASGRVFVAATSTNAEQGALYAIDLIARAGRVELEIAFVSEMGLGSGSSPSLSPSGDAVYVSDEDGFVYAVDARSGAIRWRVPTRATSAAVAVGGNGDVYALQAYGPALIAITKEGRVRWESDLGALAKAALPSSWLLGEPAAIGNGNPTVVDEVVLVPALYGYETEIGRRIPWPVISSLVAVDARTGLGRRDVVRLADDSTGITAVLPDGSIVNSLGTAITSGVSPLAPFARWLLPGDHRLLPARGGIQVSRPLD